MAQRGGATRAIIGQLIESLPAGAAVLGPDGTVERANALMRVLLGADICRGRIVDPPARVLLHADGTPLPAEEDPVLAALSGTPCHSVELRLHDAGAGDRAAVLSAAPLEDGGALVLVQDTTSALERATDLAGALAELETHDKMLSALLGNTREGIAMFDGVDLRVHWANVAFRRMLGLAEDEPVERRRLQEFHPAAEADGLADVLRGAAVSGEPYTVDEDEREAADGSATYWRWTVVPVPRDDRLTFDPLLIASETTDDVLARRRAEGELRRLEDVLANMSDGVMVALGPRRLHVNPAAREALALPGSVSNPCTMADILAHVRFELLDGTPVDERHSPFMRLVRGEEVSGEEVRALPEGAEPRLISYSGRLVGDGDEGIVVVNIHDITQRKEIEQRLAEETELDRALNRINTAIGATLDGHDIMRRAVHEVPAVLGADGSFIAGRAGSVWIVREGWGTCAECVGQQWGEGDAEALTLSASARMPIFVEDTRADERLTLLSGRRDEVRALVSLPLNVRGEVTYVLGIEWTSEPRRFSKPEEDFIDRIGQSVSLSLENARLYHIEHRIAEVLQESMLQLPNRIPGVDFSYLYRPARDTARVGGDFYDMFEIDEDLLAFMIGDISGKGLEAAAATSLVRSTLKAHIYEGQMPAESLAKTNLILLRSSAPESFATVFLGVLKRSTGELTYCGAGHPPPLLVGRGDDVRTLEARCPVIGVLPSAWYVDSHLLVLPGERLLMYTDGIIEARREKDLYGEQRLLDFVRGLHGSTPVWDLPQAVLAEVSRYSDGRLTDDIALLAVALQSLAVEAAGE